MKKICHCIATLYWTVVLGLCQKCLDPRTSNPHNIAGNAKLNPDSKYYADQPDSIIFSNVRVYTLSQSPLVQYILLGTENNVLALRLKDPYPDSHRNFWHTDYSGTVQFGDFEYITENDFQVEEIVKKYGTFRDKALRDIKEHCDLLVMQEWFEKILSFLMIAAIALMCYVVYSIFNFLVNYSTLTKTGTRTAMSGFYALSHALTSRGIFKHQKQEMQKIHFDMHKQMTKQEEKLKALEEEMGFYKLLAQNKKLSECTYDYIIPEMKKVAEGNLENIEIALRHSNNVRNSQISDYLTPINYCDVQKSAF